MALEVVKANGIYLRTSDGKRYIDLISGIGVSNLGHRPNDVLTAIRKQLGKYTHTMVFGEHIQAPQVQLAKKLSSCLPKNLNSTFLVNSGSEAIEGALKLAKRHTKRRNFVAFNNAYHGSSHGALSLMSDTYYSNFYRPLLPGVSFLDYNETIGIEQIDDQTAAVIIEIVQGEAGYIPGTESFLKKIKARCVETGALLIVDEIQTGIGRTGRLFAFEHFGIVPDILCLAKAFGGGMPLGAFVSSKSIMSCLSDKPVLGHISTFGGHPVSSTAALASLRLLGKLDVMKTINTKEQLFRKLLVHKQIQSMTGLGLMLGVELNSDKSVQKVIAFMLEHGIITDWFLFAPNKIRIAPPLIITEKEIAKVCKVMLLALDDLG